MNEEKMQNARLTTADGKTMYVVEVPAFPGNPALVKYKGMYFVGGEVGYGVEYVSYGQVPLYQAS